MNPSALPLIVPLLTTELLRPPKSDCDTVRAGGGNRAAVGDCVTVTPSADGDTVRAGRMDRPGVNKIVAVQQENAITIGAGAPANRYDTRVVDGVARAVGGDAIRCRARQGDGAGIGQRVTGTEHIETDAVERRRTDCPGICQIVVVTEQEHCGGAGADRHRAGVGESVIVDALHAGAVVADDDDAVVDRAIAVGEIDRGLGRADHNRAVRLNRQRQVVFSTGAEAGVGYPATGDGAAGRHTGRRRRTGDGGGQKKRGRRCDGQRPRGPPPDGDCCVHHLHPRGAN